MIFQIVWLDDFENKELAYEFMCNPIILSQQALTYKPEENCLCNERE